MYVRCKGYRSHPSVVVKSPCPDSQGGNKPFDFRGHVPPSRG